MEPAVQAVPAHRVQAAGVPLLLDHDHAEPVRGPGDLDLLAGGVRRVVAREHEDLVGVLVVGDEYLTAALTWQVEQVQEVVVVAELAGLRRGGLPRLVERGGAAQDGVAPADQDALGIALGDDDGVHGVRLDGPEAQALGGVGIDGAAVTAVASVQRLGRGGGHVGAGRDGHAARGGGQGDHGAGPQHGAAGEGVGDDVAEVGVAAGVRGLVGAGVTALEPAGEGGPAAVVAREQRKKSVRPHSASKSMFRYSEYQGTVKSPVLAGVAGT